MTVKELISALAALPTDRDVLVDADNGFLAIGSVDDEDDCIVIYPDRGSALHRKLGLAAKDNG